MICLPSRSLERAKGDVRLWRVAIHHVLVKAKLYSEDELAQRLRRPYILSFSGGQNPVFWVDGQYVIKFYSYTYAGEEFFHREWDALTFLANFKLPSDERLEIPRLIAKGKLYGKAHQLIQGRKPSAEHWRWPFVVETFVKGQPICNLAAKMTHEDKVRAARYLGKVPRVDKFAVIIYYEQTLRALHEADYSSSTAFDKDDAWDYFRNFLHYQYKHVVENYRRAKGMNEAILTAIPAYLPKHPEHLYLDQKAAPSLLHADMTDENLLGTMENGVWEPVGLLDFGDVRLGHRVYELMPIHIDVFKLDATLTMEYLCAYGLECYNRETFVYTAMCYTILHSQDAFRSIFNHRPELFDVRDIHELARAVWELPWPTSA